MYFGINGGNVSFGENTVLRDIHFEVKNREKVAIVGRNGCGKTTLLNLISGDIDIDPASGEGVSKSSDINIGRLSQHTFSDNSATMFEEVNKAFLPLLRLKADIEETEKQLNSSASPELAQKYADMQEHFKLLGGLYYQRELESMIKNFGFSAEDKEKPLSAFSGGQRTKIAFMKLLLSKPDVLLLDEPTNHLDMQAVKWLEEYIKNYPCAVVTVSHDQMFLDNTAEIVYEIERGRIKRYVGNYTKFRAVKEQNYEKQKKDYIEQQKEIAKLNELIERFRYKATKAKMVQSKIKYLERMEIIEPPQEFDLKAFYGGTEPTYETGSTVFSVKDLEIGYDKVIASVNLTLEKGRKLGIIGGNGLGKSTFLKTLMGIIPPKSGYIDWGYNVDKGYFDQQMAERKTGKSVLDDYWEEFPTLTETEIRNDLGAFLFSGETVFKNTDVLSGGERVRLALCKIFKKRPNLLILDEPTNHTDIVGKEALENMLKEYKGSLICVSHDRYFIKELCDSLLIFDNDKVTFYPYSYADYERSLENAQPLQSAPEKSAEKKPQSAKQKYVSPLKERQRTERKIEKLEEKIALCEEKIAGLKTELGLSENAVDYQKLSEISELIEAEEAELSGYMEEWESLSDYLSNLLKGE